LSELTAAALGGDPSLYPWTGKRLDVGGAKLHYLDVGGGTAGSLTATLDGRLVTPRPTLLMVHGNPTWSFYWRDLVKALSPQWRCVVPDHIGMGLSDKPGDDTYEYTLERRVEDLDKLVDAAIPAGKIVLIVHDWGGMIGLGWAVRNVERIAKIVVLNTSAFVPSAEIKLPWQLKLARSLLGTILVQGGNTFAVGATRMCTVKRMPAAVRRGFVAPYRSFAERISTLRFVQDIPLSPADKAWDVVEATDKGLAQFTATPVLIHWGMKDFVFHGGFLAQFRKRWPHAEVTEYQAGHYVLEDETEAVIASILRFLEP
jgi:cis-3-alkyl-4-acyloxetan-2-one decarboxylase